MSFVATLFLASYLYSFFVNAQGTCTNYTTYTIDFGSDQDAGRGVNTGQNVMGPSPNDEFGDGNTVFYAHPLNVTFLFDASNQPLGASAYYPFVCDNMQLFMDNSLSGYSLGANYAESCTSFFGTTNSISGMDPRFLLVWARTNSSYPERTLRIIFDEMTCPFGVLEATWNAALVSGPHDLPAYNPGNLPLSPHTINFTAFNNNASLLSLSSDLPQVGSIRVSSPGSDVPFWASPVSFSLGSIPTQGTPYLIPGPYINRIDISFPGVVQLNENDTSTTNDVRAALMDNLIFTCCSSVNPLITGCSDSVLVPNEQCDDGNTNNGDGCNSDCQEEIGFQCITVNSSVVEGFLSSVCTPICGDGITLGNETCDSVPGCTTDCQPAEGFQCTSNSGVIECVSTCGDGIQAFDEECDDGNTKSGDGCSSGCTNELSTQTTIIIVVVVVVTVCCCIIGISIAIFFIYRKNTEVEKIKTEYSSSVIQFGSEFKTSRGSALNPITELNGVTIGDIIGKGNFGNVYRGDWNGNPVALKSLKSDDVKEMQNEIMLLRNLENPQVLRCWGIFWENKGEPEEEIYIVTEFMSKGDLLSLLQNDVTSGSTNIPLSELVSISHQCALGMDFLHENKVIHRDLACRNLLVEIKNNAFSVKISDFGLSRFTDDYYKSESKAVPVRWTAPEAIKYHKFTKQSDVWSYGIVLWEIFSRGQVPYAGWSNKKVIEKTANAFKLTPPKETPEDIAKIMTSCWEADINDRPLFQKIKQDFDVYFLDHPKLPMGSGSSSSVFSAENRYHNPSTKHVEHAYANTSPRSNEKKPDYNTDDEDPNERYTTRVSLFIDPDDLPLPRVDSPEDFYNNTSSQGELPNKENPNRNSEEGFYNTN